MTTLVYNGVTLRDCETLSFSQDIEYDESKTDVIFSRFRIRVASTVVASHYAEQRPFGVATFRGSTIAQKQHEIQAKLSEPRKDFWFLVDGCPDNERDETPGVLDQPVLIATGKAFDEFVSGNSVVKTELFMSPHPFSQNSTTVIYGNGAGVISKALVLDCNNGPKPISVSVEKIIGGRSLRVVFEIEVCRNIANPDFIDQRPAVFGTIEPSGNKVLSNRWSLEEAKDENWITTRTLQGTLRVSHSSYWPHAMRYLCLPSLLKGYKRVRQSFVSDPTDLVLKYRVEDRQAFAAPPYPAIDWSGHHIEAATGANGIIKTGEFQIRLTGPLDVDKQQLIAAAGKVAVNRIRGLAQEPNAADRTQRLLLKNASIVDVLHEPTIEMRVQVQYTDPSFKSFALRVKSVGQPLDTLDGTEYTGNENLEPYTVDGYSPRSWPVPLVYDSATPAGIFACYLQSPLSVWHDMPNERPIDGNQQTEPDDRTEPDESGNPDGSGMQYVEHVPVEDRRYEPTTVDLYEYPYTFIELQSRYRINNGWRQFPLADTDPEAEKTAELIQLHGRTANRLITMTATREGKPPVIPSMREDQIDPNGYREVLSTIDIIAKAPTLLADGRGRRYEVWLEYVYLMEKGPGPTNILRGTSSPIDLFSPDSNSLNLSSIIDTGGHLQWQEGVTTTFPTSGA